MSFNYVIPIPMEKFWAELNDLASDLLISPAISQNLLAAFIDSFPNDTQDETSPNHQPLRAVRRFLCAVLENDQKREAEAARPPGLVVSHEGNYVVVTLHAPDPQHGSGIPF